MVLRLTSRLPQGKLVAAVVAVNLGVGVVGSAQRMNHEIAVSW